MGKYRVLGSFLDRVFRNNLNDNFNDVDADIRAQKKRVDDLILSVPQPSEVIDARGGAPVLRDRLDGVDAQLAETETVIGVNIEKFKIIAPEADDTGRFQRALDELAGKKGSLVLSAKTYYISSVLVKGIYSSIIGAGKNATKIICTSTSENAIETDSTISRLYDVSFEKFTIQMPNLASGTALKINNPNRVSVTDVEITCASGQRSSGIGIHILRNSELTDGYFVHLHNCRANKQSIGIRLEGASVGYANAHWITECSLDDNSLYGVHLKNTTFVHIRGMNHFEINYIGIYNETSYYTVIDGNYFERQAKYDVQIVSGDGVLVKGGNRFATTAQTDASGRAIKINAGEFHRVIANEFIDVYPAYDISIDSGAKVVSILDNIAKNRDTEGGWATGGVQVEDNGVDTIRRNLVRTAGGTNRTEYRGKHHFYDISFENGLPIQNRNARIYAGTGNPEGVVTAYRGSLYLRTDGGNGYTFYVKETGDNINTGWVAK